MFQFPVEKVSGTKEDVHPGREEMVHTFPEQLFVFSTISVKTAHFHKTALP